MSHETESICPSCRLPKRMTVGSGPPVCGNRRCELFPRPTKPPVENRSAVILSEFLVAAVGLGRELAGAVTQSGTADDAGQILMEFVHEEMCGLGANDLYASFAHGALFALAAMGLVSPAGVRAWVTKLPHCPGHPASSSFCCFCGDVCPVCGRPDGKCVEPAQCAKRRAET